LGVTVKAVQLNYRQILTLVRLSGADVVPTWRLPAIY